jgi:uncharacterized cupredoxin-like copper-binding protein
VRIASPARIGFSARLAAGAAVLLVAAGCGARSLTGPVASVVTDVSEQDFEIQAPHSLGRGDVVLRVHNKGPDAHELIVIKTPHGRLPLRADGLTVNEEALEKQTVGALEPGDPGGTRELRFHATPGVYVLLCNMSGHYLGGMRSVLVVR